MARYGFVSIIHIVALVLSIIVLGLTAYDVSVFHGFFGNYDYGNSPARVNFQLFNALWSIVVLLYIGIAPIYMTGIFHRIAALVLEALTSLFWFAGSIALAVIYGVHSCAAGDHVCGTIKAASAFGFFLWALFSALVVIDALESFRGGHRKNVNTANNTV